MSSLRHNAAGDPAREGAPSGQPARAVDDAVSRGLDAARESILAVGWRRTTLTEVARRAGVSRMTMYRRWPDMQTLLSDLMTREWAGVVADAADARTAPDAAGIAAEVVATAAALRANPLFRRIVEVDPELLLPYLLDRRGRTQDTVLELVASAVAEGQRTGAVRDGDPTLLARIVVLAAHGHVLSAHTMTGTPDSPGPTVAELDAELRALVERYLAP